MTHATRRVDCSLSSIKDATPMKPTAVSVMSAAVALFVACTDDPTQQADGLPLAGQILHVESDHGLTLAGSAVTGWADQSAFNNDGLPFSKAPTPGSQNLDGKTTVRFAGDGGRMVGAQGLSFDKRVPSLSGCTSFVLLRVQDPGAPISDISLRVPELRGVDTYEATIELRAIAVDGVLNLAYTANGKVLETTLPALDRWTLLTAVLAGNGDVRLFADGSMLAQGAVGVPAAAGRSVSLYGGITSAETASLIVYDRVLSDSERASVESYILQKWRYR